MGILKFVTPVLKEKRCSFLVDLTILKNKHLPVKMELIKMNLCFFLLFKYPVIFAKQHRYFNKGA